MTKKPFHQLGVLLAHLPTVDPTRVDRTFPVLFSYMSSKSTAAYIELFRALKSFEQESVKFIGTGGRPDFLFLQTFESTLILLLRLFCSN